MFGGGDTNLYAYTWADPINWADPDGLEGKCIDNCSSPLDATLGGGAGGGGGQPTAANPVGRINNPIEVSKGSNCAGEVGGRSYSGHAFDRMQGRGITPSTVENTISGGASNVQPNGNIQFHDPTNNITVITNQQGGVVTVRPGGPK